MKIVIMLLMFMLSGTNGLFEKKEIETVETIPIEEEMVNRLENMPLTGSVKFWDINLDLPKEYVRDSTCSTIDEFIYESGNYKKYIVLTYAYSGYDMEDYYDLMSDRGCDVEYRDILSSKSVVSRWYDDEDKYRQEVYMKVKGGTYAIMLCGGDEEEFEALIEEIN